MKLSMEDLKELLVGNAAQAPLAADGEQVVVVLQRGWVAVGKWPQAGALVELREASVVRHWGTTGGLGELAEKGPLPETVLDPAPQGMRFHVLSVVALFPCAAAWSGR